MDDSPFEPILFRALGFVPDDFSNVGHRLRVQRRRILNEGVAGFLLGMLFLSVAAILGRAAWATWVRYRDEVGAEIRGVTARNEPRINEERMGVLSSVLAPVNGIISAGLLSPSSDHSPWPQRDGEHYADAKTDPQAKVGAEAAADHERSDDSTGAAFERTCAARRDQALAAAEQIQQAFDELFAIALRARAEHLADSDKSKRGAAQSKVRDSVRRNLTVFAQRVTSHEPPAGWVDIAAARVLAYATKSVSLLTSEEPSSWSSAVEALGPAIAWHDPIYPDCATVVPSLRRNRYVDPDDPEHLPGPAPAPELSDREEMALLITGLLGPATALFEHDLLAKKTDSDAFSILQVFFVSPDSVLALYNPSLRTKRLADALPPAKLWAAANYVQSPLNNDEPAYTSPAYIDFVEGGFVLTKARALRLDRIDPNSGARISRGGQFVGVVAVDMQLPTDELVDYLAVKTNLLNVRRAKIHQSTNGGEIKVELYKPTYGGLVINAPLAWVPDDECESAFQHELNLYRSDPDLWREILELRVNDEQAFLLPLRNADSGTREVLLVTYRTPNVPVATRWATALAILCAGTAVGFVFFGWRNSIRSAELRNKVWLMSNLQVGVLSLDEKDRIIEANDRAMEIVGRLLPKAGVPYSLDDLEPVEFASLIDDDVYERTVEVDELEDVRSMKEGDFTGRKYSTDIASARGRGLSSRYYAHLKEPVAGKSRWIRVWGTPILGRPASGGMRRTFGIIERTLCESVLDDCRKRLTTDSKTKPDTTPPAPRSA